jgi:hypothetical protein
MYEMANEIGGVMCSLAFLMSKRGNVFKKLIKMTRLIVYNCMLMGLRFVIFIFNGLEFGPLHGC